MSTAKYSLTTRIVVGMGAGILLGLLLRILFPGSEWVEAYITGGILDIGGRIFVASLKMLVVPLVFVSLVCGTCSLKDINQLGRLGGKTLGLYLVTTGLAIATALLVATLFNPGSGMHLTTEVTFNAKEAPSLGQVIVDMFPTNPFKAMTEGNMLQVIVFALLFGIAIALSGKAGDRIATIMQDLNEVIMKLVTLLMNLAPYGVFCLLAKLFANLGFEAIGSLLGYFMLVLGVLLIHAFINYSVILKLLSGLNPIIFMRKMVEAVMFAFSTASSNATIPVTMETVTKRMGVKNKIASFTVPLGATINMDGTSIMQGVATVFIANVYGIDLSMTDYLLVIATATLASVGTAGVPGVGLITLAMVLQQVGLPVEGIALIMGVDRLLDMVRTAVNITGDSMVSCIVAKSEGEFDQGVFNDEHAGEADEELHLEEIGHRA